ncbi:MAG: methanethiol S-methyltransferase [Planctomycetota bacterium]|jgi:protein-S-isoprenylcysteine O-methyltransferase Ste14
MSRILVFVYGLIAYVAFLAAFLYAIGFVGNSVVPKSIDSGVEGPATTSILINMLLLGLFAVQHTIMARPGFKAWWTTIVPRSVERSTFVLATSLLLMLLFWQWRPMGAIVWSVDSALPRTILTGVSLAGWGLVLYGSFLIDHFDLFGLRQVLLHLRGRPYKHHPFMERSVYRLIRHPLMAGFIIAFWATPTMTEGHLLFACVTTAYIFFGIKMEERDLLKMLGDDYRRYHARTPMLLPGLKKMRVTPESGGAAEDQTAS